MIKCPHCSSPCLDKAIYCQTCGQPIDKMPENRSLSSQRGGVSLIKSDYDLADPTPVMTEPSDQYQPQQVVIMQNSGVVQPILPNPVSNVPDLGTNTKQWVGMILLCTCLGVISLIYSLVTWRSTTTPPIKKAFCKATFIISLLAHLLCLVLPIAVALLCGWWELMATVLDIF